VSHSKERKEKVCLNCGTNLAGRYCHSCGQENLEPKETVWGLVSHFLNDITHFDGKFFSTVKYLIIRPGFLSAEYIKGRRASYLHPIRMYVFTASFFFIIFFSVFNPTGFLKGNKSREEEIKEFTEARESLNGALKKTKDSVLIAAIERTALKVDKRISALQQEETLQKQKDSLHEIAYSRSLDSLDIKTGNTDTITARIVSDIKKAKARKKVSNDGDVADNAKIGFSDDFKFSSQIAYDSVQLELPENKRDGGFKKLLMHRGIFFNKKFQSDKKEAMTLFLEKFMHTLPQALFISLPIYALLLLMLYARRKNFYYVDHGIFSIHLYCATFIMLLFYFALDKLGNSTGWTWLNIPKGLIVLGIFFYLYKALRKFYQQGIMKTIAKFIILNIFSLFVVIFLVALFFFLSFLQFS
jgi:Protein of unknown function (DUF3667)